MGDLALACLCLSVERGKDFTSVANEAAEKNRQTGELHYAKYLSSSIVMRLNVGSSWPCDIPWRLCQVAYSHDPHEAAAVRELLMNLDHHFSQVRLWAMEIAWFALPWLDPVEAPRRLLKNLADTLVGPFKAAGVAARFFGRPEGFLDFAKTFRPPEVFKEQYQQRLEYVEKEGVFAMQSSYWETEALCRKEIERAVMGWRLRKVGEQIA